MDKSAYYLWDWHRILFGNAPVLFMAETLFRTIVTYFFLLMVVAQLGKRMSGQVTITELGIAIMLGAIVAPPMETPERGVVSGLFILLLVLVLHRTTAWSTVKWLKAEKVIQGSLDICVRNGVIDVGVIRKIRVSRAQLFGVLRLNQIYNLGAVDRVYMEASGIFSIFMAVKAKPGLSLLPSADRDVHLVQEKPVPDLLACTSCGKTMTINAEGTRCPLCGNTHWDAAVL